MQKAAPTITPVSIEVEGLKIATYQFCPTDVEENPARKPVLIAHGFVDSGATFGHVAAEIARESGRKVYAFDWRGHGRSDWIGPGGYYHFFDYVGELDGVVRALFGDRTFHLVGHSMGGVVSTYWAGTRPGNLCSLGVLEGVGIPDSPVTETYGRMQSWLATMARGRPPARMYASREEIRARMAQRAPGLDEPMLDFVVDQLARQDEGGWCWRFDPYHRTRGPYVFQEEIWQAFAMQIQVPTLLVHGDRSTITPELDHVARRNAILSDQAPTVIAGADHMLHWTRPQALAQVLLQFMERVEDAAASSS